MKTTYCCCTSGKKQIHHYDEDYWDLYVFLSILGYTIYKSFYLSEQRSKSIKMFSVFIKEFNMYYHVLRKVDHKQSHFLEKNSRIITVNKWKPNCPPPPIPIALISIFLPRTYYLNANNKNKLTEISLSYLSNSMNHYTCIYYIRNQWFC